LHVDVLLPHISNHSLWVCMSSLLVTQGLHSKRRARHATSCIRTRAFANHMVAMSMYISCMCVPYAEAAPAQQRCLAQICSNPASLLPCGVKTQDSRRLEGRHPNPNTAPERGTPHNSGTTGDGSIPSMSYCKYPFPTSLRHGSPHLYS
jgi:hypothetical protein